MALVVPDSLSGEPRPVRARGRSGLRLYVCGPTVYDVAHVGHARTYLYFDLVRRWFEARGTRVRHIMNITDFEDKITARAAALGLGWRTLARREERGFRRDLAGLGLRPPHATPRASDFVPQMIGAIRRLERRHQIERRGDGWYFHGDARAPGPNFPVANVLADHAVPEPDHPFPADPRLAQEFLAWKPQEPPAPSWPSPWGRGAPGWHLECFAMAEEKLHLPVDLHGGGRDLIFPHHFAENEVAYALDRQPFARTFLHTGFVTAHGRKMSKSGGTLVPLGDALREFGPDALRWALLARPVTENVEWRRADAVRAARDHARLRAEVGGFLSDGAGGQLSVRDLRAMVGDVDEALRDGFRVERAFAAVRRYVAAAARRPMPRFARGDRSAARRRFAEVESLLGLRLL
jgi:cysteinyl-tRNA synthetase